MILGLLILACLAFSLLAAIAFTKAREPHRRRRH
jgi:hypothetical protein